VNSGLPPNEYGSSFDPAVHGDLAAQSPLPVLPDTFFFRDVFQFVVVAEKP